MEDQYINVTENGEITVEVKVICLQDGDYIVAYSPALRLAASGETEQMAKESFNITLRIFVDDLFKKSLLKDELLSLGWTFNEQSYHRNLTAEDIISSMPNLIGQQNLHYVS